MKKKILGGIAIVAIAVAVAFNVSVSNQKSDKASLLALANVEALAFEVGNVPWYDFINNYLGTPQQIPVTTTNCNSGSIMYEGVEISLSNCTEYSYVVSTPCYDGGNSNECTSDKKTYL